MQSFLLAVSVGSVAEIGDKTQLLLLVLSLRLRKSAEVFFGMLAAVLLSHTLAAVVGEWIGAYIEHHVLCWGIGMLFIAMAIWCLGPHRIVVHNPYTSACGAFMSTLIIYFLAEIGDRTNIATAGLSAQSREMIPVLLGTTVGETITNTPIVLFGRFLAEKIELQWIYRAAAVVFAGVGIISFFDIDLL
jgi:putative Ca2+/H+ antiporter (TMEM165/GDT1 family)